MSAYRDSFEKCPRCAVELQDARSVRGCPACGGLFVQEGVLTEMVQRMLPPGPLVRLQLELLAHADPPLGCPACGDTMEQSKLLQVPIERCAKHGVWFDRDELERVLHRTATVERPPVVEASSAGSSPQRHAVSGTVGSRPASPARANAAAPSLNDPSDGTTEQTLHVHVRDPSGVTHTFALARAVIKIGRIASAHICLPDRSVSRLHTVIEVAADGLHVIDLGSAAGTLVNGARVHKHVVQPGDAIQIGVYTMAFGAS